MDRPEQTLSAVLDAGELLLTSGAEAARVEDTCAVWHALRFLYERMC